jgi:LacI family transcriptional regulator
MAVTIRDVASRAGVSAMTVSKVLHGSGSNVRVSEQTATLIREVAREMNYQPNALARSLRQRRTKCIGLVFEGHPRVAGPSGYFADLIDGVVDVAFMEGYSVMMCPSLTNHFQVAGSVSDGRFDGILWCRNTDRQENLHMVEQSGRPIVVLHEPPEGREHVMSHVSWDNRQAMTLAVDHLVALGHRRLHIVVSNELVDNPEWIVRRTAFIERMAHYGLTLERSSVLAWQESCEDVRALWDAGLMGTAIIPFSESMALNLLTTLREHGVRVPEELSVVAFDSTIRAASATPPLTAVHQPIRQMAQQATRLLIRRILGQGGRPGHEVFGARLDLRASTGPPRA